MANNALHAQKKPVRILRKYRNDGVAHVDYEADFWEGPDGSDGPVGYTTRRATIHAGGPFPGTCSFAADLRRALNG